MTHQPKTELCLAMAPLKGITDALFRSVYLTHFTGIDTAIAPFINPQSKAVVSDKLIRDILPKNNGGLPLVPQLINNNAADFLQLANRIAELGYPEINWNLGCPVTLVAKKRRGAGLLPYPEQIEQLLDKIIPQLPLKLSIKMRLGFHHFQESLTLLPRLEKYPLSEIIIHARLGKQLYQGNTFPDQFINAAEVTRHTVCYNGDITSMTIFTELKKTIPSINRFMIGRGLISNPFLPAEIKGASISDNERRNRISAFHEDLYQKIKTKSGSHRHLLGRMKQIWIYLIESFPEKRKLLRQLTRATSEQKYLEAAAKILQQ